MSKSGHVEALSADHLKADAGPYQWKGSRSIDCDKMATAAWASDDNSQTRVIEGIATTVRGNSHGYAVAPLGAKYVLPLPLVLGHETKRRIGWVIDAEVDPFSIRFMAWLSRFDVYPDTERVWRDILMGKLRGVSAGHGGEIGDWHHYRADVDKVAHSWKWSELTVCEMGANLDARILLAYTVDRAVGREYVNADFRPRQKQKPVRYRT